MNLHAHNISFESSGLTAASSAVLCKEHHQNANCATNNCNHVQAIYDQQQPDSIVATNFAQRAAPWNQQQCQAADQEILNMLQGRPLPSEQQFNNSCESFTNLVDDNYDQQLNPNTNSTGGIHQKFRTASGKLHFHKIRLNKFKAVKPRIKKLTRKSMLSNLPGKSRQQSNIEFGYLSNSAEKNKIFIGRSVNNRISRDQSSEVSRVSRQKHLNDYVRLKRSLVKKDITTWNQTQRVSANANPHPMKDLLMFNSSVKILDNDSTSIMDYNQFNQPNIKNVTQTINTIRTDQLTDMVPAYLKSAFAQVQTASPKSSSASSDHQKLAESMNQAQQQLMRPSTPPTTNSYATRQAAVSRANHTSSASSNSSARPRSERNSNGSGGNVRGSQQRNQSGGDGSNVSQSSGSVSEQELFRIFSGLQVIQMTNGTQCSDLEGQQ